MSGTRSGTPADPRPGGDPAAAARAELVRQIRAGGHLGDARWRAAFEDVPRHLFVPYYYVATARGYQRLSGSDPDPQRRARWLEGVYTDGALATCMQDGELVSSSSQPSLMAMMLEELRVEEAEEQRPGTGCRVLEIGTGTGYNAALLAHRLGDGRVTTVDLDEEITGPAQERLAAAGRRPTVVTGDGARGCPERAPYDRVIATCALPSVPPAWIAQCTPGALILAPLATGLIALRVTDPAAVRAEGRFLATPAYFVPLRTRSDPGARPGPEKPDTPGRRRDFRFGYGLPREVLRDERFQFLWTLTADGLTPREALVLWQRENRPRRERFGVTVHDTRQYAWLDSPDGAHRWPLPGG
ncbi:methyltransferase [Streptomyces sp. CB02923]|uniref:methyltransferase domain-containing protein n=1 Tax=Streptomyces sp. CB02923 TaxID=1718985 RepID=UPI00093D27A6|nr:methyltransferase domain-containing protein [Streptomyces sp. CB02923]OKI04610.1 methyltransferase [Streptomyces sp. CB02923]